MSGVAALREVARIGAADDLLVLTCVADTAVSARLREALRGRGVVRSLGTFADIADFLRRSPERVDIIVVPSRDAALRDATGFIRQTAKAFPDVALIAYSGAGAEHSSDIRSMALAGVHQFFFAAEESRIALRSMLASARRQCASDRVLSELATVLDETSLPIVEACLARPAAMRTVDDLVNAIGLHRKTLYNHCRRSGLSGPAELIAWSRLSLVAYLLGRTGRTVESIAEELDFASPSALRNAIKRYTGLTATDVRAAGGLPCVTSVLAARLANCRVSRAPLHVV